MDKLLLLSNTGRLICTIEYGLCLSLINTDLVLLEFVTLNYSDKKVVDCKFWVMNSGFSSNHTTCRIQEKSVLSLLTPPSNLQITIRACLIVLV